MKPLYKYERIKHQANFKKDIWLKKLKDKLTSTEQNLNNNEKQDEVKSDLKLILNEIKKEQLKNKLSTKEFNTDNFKLDSLNKEKIKQIDKYLKKLQSSYIEAFRKADSNRNKYIQKQTKTKQQKDSFANIKKQYSNESLEDFVTNRSEVKDIIEYNGKLYQKKDLIYLYPDKSIQAHFYAPKKKIFGRYYKTLYVNIIIIWFATILLYFLLYFSVLRKLLDSFNTVKTKLEKRKNKNELPF